MEFERRRKEIERWLSSQDPSTNYNQALQQRQKGTGVWFLQSSTYPKWNTQRNSFLFLNGIPGCGKTILSSTIIEDLKRILPRQPLLYFYFDFNETKKQTLEGMVRSLIDQLHSTCGNTSKILDSLFSSNGDGRRQPDCESLCEALLRMIEQVKEVWIVIDALDECSTRKGGPTKGLLSWMREVLNSEQRNVHLLVTSRPEQDIGSGIMTFAHNDDMVPIESSLISDDIREYIRRRVKADEGLKRWQNLPEVQNEIEARLTEKAGGMYD